MATKKTTRKNPSKSGSDPGPGYSLRGLSDDSECLLEGEHVHLRGAFRPGTARDGEDQKTLGIGPDDIIEDSPGAGSVTRHRQNPSLSWRTRLGAARWRAPQAIAQGPCDRAREIGKGRRSINWCRGAARRLAPTSPDTCGNQQP